MPRTIFLLAIDSWLVLIGLGWLVVWAIHYAGGL